MTVCAILAVVDTIHWLSFLYVCGYIKLTTTIIMTMPQMFMNYKRKSTVGWSIYGVFIDLTGGVFSMLQMLLNAYNYGKFYFKKELKDSSYYLIFQF